MAVGEGVGEEVPANKFVKNDSEIVPSRGSWKWNNTQMILGIKNYYKKKKGNEEKTFFCYLKYYCFKIIDMIKGERHHSLPLHPPHSPSFRVSFAASRDGVTQCFPSRGDGKHSVTPARAAPQETTNVLLSSLD